MHYFPVLLATRSTEAPSPSQTCGSPTSLSALSCGDLSRVIVFGIMTGFIFLVFMGLLIRMCYDTQKKRKPTQKKHDIEAPPPPPLSDWTAIVTKEGKITWDDGSMKSAWARMNDHMQDLEEHRPSGWERRTFPGKQVVIDARPLPGTNHTVRIKPLPGQLEPRMDIREGWTPL